MAEFESPTYILDLRHGLNRATLVGAIPGKEIDVLVRPEDDEFAQPTRAKGTLSADGQFFEVVVSTGSGEQTHSWNFEVLKSAIRAHRERR